MRRTIPILLAALACGAGLSPVTAAPAGAVETCDGRVATIVAPVPTTYPVPPVLGTAGDDVIVGSPLRETIHGGGGNDTICGMDGADTIHGDAGDDRLFGGLDDEYWPDDGYSGDVLVPGPGNDLVDMGDDPDSADIDSVDRFASYDTVSYRDASGPVHVDLAEGVATGEGRDTIVTPTFSGGVVGSDFDDVLRGSAGPDRIDGGGGDDRIEARAGKDDVLPDNEGRPWSEVPSQLDVAAGDDVVLAGGGRDLVWTKLGSDRVVGGGGRDYLHHEGPGGRLVGGDGRDSIDAGPGVDQLGGDDRDELSSVLGRSRHEVDGGRDRDVLTLRAPLSTFGWGRQWRVERRRERLLVDGRRLLDYGSVEDLRFSASGGRLTYVGGPGADGLSASRSLRVRAFGGRGPDSLQGGRFDDLLVGGPGRDALLGEDGRDRCLTGERHRSCELRR